MDKNHFIEDFMMPLNDKLAAEKRKTYITGDFNFDLSGITNKESFNFYETMMSSFQLPVITLPTKINSKKHTIIDNIFTNQIHRHEIRKPINLNIGPFTIIFYSTQRQPEPPSEKAKSVY